MSNSKREVNRYFVAILYPDDKNFNDYKNYIEKNFEDVTYILHNRDIDENGEIKKPHYHIMWKVGENARSKRAVAHEIGIEENYVQGCNKIAMLRYLIHLDDDAKTRYRVEEVQGKLKKELEEELLKEIPEKVKYRSIIKAIEDRKIKNTTTLLLWAINHECITEVKKMQFLLNKIIEEHKTDEKLQKN